MAPLIFSDPDGSAPECWWGPDGIDAHGIGDGIPYEYEDGSEA